MVVLGGPAQANAKCAGEGRLDDARVGTGMPRGVLPPGPHRT